MGMGPTLTPMNGVVNRREGHVILENHETGYYEEFESVADFLAYYVGKMREEGRSHQAISGFKRKWMGKL